MVITLKPGETAQIEFEGTDGSVSVIFAADRLQVDVGQYYDSTGRHGVVYEEIFDQPIPVS